MPPQPLTTTATTTTATTTAPACGFQPTRRGTTWNFISPIQRKLYYIQGAVHLKEYLTSWSYQHSTAA